MAGLSEGTLLPQAVAGALGVREQPGMSLTEELVGALKTKNMLLLMDNCEHLLDATTHLAEKLLNSCPRLRILATSREPLGVAGEVNWLVSPLSMPDSARPLTAEGLMRYEAVRLFVERARLRLPAFELMPHNAGAVAEVCRTLEGIPLAIELATARMAILAVEQVAEKLEDSLKLLTGGARTSTQRHHTMRATLEWSYDLLDEDEQRLFARLSVFAGGWTLEAAEKVGAGDSIETDAVLDLLGRLVDKSLIVAKASSEEGAMRYRMLEPVRQFAREKLEESTEAEATLRRIADFFLDLAEEAEPNVRGPQQGEWLERLANEHENFRAALGWLLDREEKLGLRLTAALWWFWYDRGHLSEGRRWLEGYLGKCSPEVSKGRAKALNGASWIAMFQGQFEDAQAYGQEALALFRELEDGEGVASALVQLGAAAVLGQLDDVPVPVLLEEATRLRPKIQDPSTIGNLSMLSGLFAAVSGEFDQSEALLGEALALFRKIGDITGICHCLTAWGLATLSGRAYEQAYALFRENLRVAWESDHKVTIQSSLLGLGAVAASREQSVRAARLWGAVEAMEEAYGIRMSLAGLYLAGYEGYLELARSRLEEVEFAEAWAEGKAMTTEEAVHYALSENTVPPMGFESVGSSSGEPPSMLTRREREIASLLARGLTTNRQISAELCISKRTVETHVRNILGKLGLRSRYQLAERFVGADRG